jgi:hypothetical protein
VELYKRECRTRLQFYPSHFEDVFAYKWIFLESAIFSYLIFRQLSISKEAETLAKNGDFELKAVKINAAPEELRKPR